MPESLMIFSHRVVCDLIKSPNSAGVPPAGSMPILAKAARTFCFATARFMASFRRMTISVGVPLFTAKPSQSSTTRSGKPCSATVGVSFRAATRQRPEFAASDEVHRDNRRQKIELICTCEQVDQALRRRLIRNVRGARASAQLEELADEMSRRSKRPRRKIESVRLALENADQFGDRLCRYGRVHDQHIGS